VRIVTHGKARKTRVAARSACVTAVFQQDVFTVLRFQRVTRYCASLFLLAGALTVASCGGGGSVTTIPQASPSPASNSETFTVPASAGTQALPAAGGRTPTLGFAAGATAGTKITATTSATAPVGAPAPSSVARHISSLTNVDEIMWALVTVSQPIPGSVIASEGLSLIPSDPTTVQYYAEWDDITSAPGTKLGTFGPGTITNGNLVINNPTTASSVLPTLLPQHTYLVQYYYLLPTTSPSPVASASPSAAPSASPSASPTPSQSPSAIPTASPSPSGAGIASGYTLAGGTDLNGPQACPVTTTPYCNLVELAYTGEEGGQVNLEFGGPPSVSTTLSGQIATSITQITPAGFPAYTGAGQVTAYMTATASPSATFPSLTATIVSDSFFAFGDYGNGCALFQYIAPNGSAATWTQLAPSSGFAGAGSGLIYLTTSTITISSTQTLLAIACQP